MSFGASIITRGLSTASGGPLVTHGLAAPGSYTTATGFVASAQATVDALALDIAEAVERLRALLEVGEQTPRDVAEFCASVTGWVEDIDTLRDDLDGTATAALVLWQDGATYIELWTWERDLREQLRRLRAFLISSCTILDEVVGGRVRTEHVVVRGQSWQSVATRYLGDPHAWRLLRDANPDVASGPLSPGTVLIIPDRG